MKVRVFLAIVLMITSAPALAAESAPPDTPPPRTAPERAPPTPTAKEKSAAAKQKPRTSDRCYTWVTECLMLDRRAVGAECWCVTPFGPAYGTAR